MNRRTTLYGLGIAAALSFLFVFVFSELKNGTPPLRADVLSEADAFAPPTVNFLTNYQEARRRASDENKPTLLFFMSDQCQYSRAMLADAFSDPEVEKLAQQFICVEIDMNDPRNEELCDSFNIVVSPTVQFTTSYGDPLQRLPNRQSGEQLADQMQEALNSVAWCARRMEGSLIRR